MARLSQAIHVVSHVSMQPMLEYSRFNLQALRRYPMARTWMAGTAGPESLWRAGRASRLESWLGFSYRVEVTLTPVDALRRLLKVTTERGLWG